MQKKNIESLLHRRPIRGNLAANYGSLHSFKLISGVFQQAAPFSEKGKYVYEIMKSLKYRAPFIYH